MNLIANKPVAIVAETQPKTEIVWGISRYDERQQVKDDKVLLRDFIREEFDKIGADGKVMAAVCEAESGLDRYAVSKTEDVGLCQIHLYNGYRMGLGKEELYDPATNITAALAIYQSQGTNAWTTYRNKRYLDFL